MAVPLILNDFFVSYVYPFVLVFVLIYALLDKSKLLGEGKSQINAIIALVVGLMFITFGNAVGIVVKMMPFLAVMLVIILVLYLLLAFVFNEEKGFVVPYYVKIVGGFVMLAAVIIAVLVATGYWDTLKSMVASGNAWLSTLVFAAIIVGVIVAVVIGSHHDK